MNTFSTTRRGSTMIEVLIAIVILAFGMMGMLGLFINSLKIGSGSVYRSVAMQQAYMMADIIRTNYVNLPNYFSPTATYTASCFNSTGCNNTTAPNAEYKVWQTQLSTLLPAGQGLVCRDPTPYNSLTSISSSSCTTSSSTAPLIVKVCWDESRIRSSNAGVTNSATTGTGGTQCVYTQI